MLDLDQFLHQSLIQVNLALNYLISFHINNGSSQVVRHCAFCHKHEAMENSFHICMPVFQLFDLPQISKI